MQSPLRRRFAGGGGRALRERFYVDLRRALQATPPTILSLAAAARQFGELIEPETLLQQVPHWMFTFPGSGTDLLVRTLALICARPDVQQRALQEVRDAGPLDDPRSIQKLAYLEACLREAGRLFPPVTKTFHRAPKGSTAAGYTIAADVECCTTSRSCISPPEQRRARVSSGPSAGSTSQRSHGRTRTCSSERRTRLSGTGSHSFRMQVRGSDAVVTRYCRP